METSDAATISDIAERLHSNVMLTVMTLLSVRLVIAYVAAFLGLYVIKMQLLINCTYARKRMFSRIIHHRKFALFPCSSKQGGFK
jgi:hypothetical protein